MAPTRRKAQPQGFVDQFREALESRIPADWRRQAERQYKDLRKQFDKGFNESQKNLAAFRKQVDQRLNRVAERGELDKLTKRIEGLQQQIEKLTRQATARRETSAAATPARTSARRSTAAKTAAGKTATAKAPAAAKKPARTSAQRAASTPAGRPARASRRAAPASQPPAPAPESEKPPPENAS